jgi:hypothetical protein
VCGHCRISVRGTRDLYERHGRQILAYCLVQLRNREDAEERGVVPELDSAWFHKIAEHVCRTRRRCIKRGAERCRFAGVLHKQ